MPPAEAKPVLLPKNDPVVAALAEWRRETCRAAGVSAYVVLPNATLLALAKERPASLKALLAVKGMGPKRVESHGLALLRVLRAKRAGAPTPGPSSSRTDPPSRRHPTRSSPTSRPRSSRRPDPS